MLQAISPDSGLRDPSLQHTAGSIRYNLYDVPCASDVRTSRGSSREVLSHVD